MCGHYEDMPHVMKLHDSRQRAREVVRMRGDGYSWGEVAATLGFSSRGAAERAYKRFCERHAPVDPALDRRMLVESAKNDMWECSEGQRRARQAGDDDTVQKYVTTKVKVRDQLARLQGAYAPEQVDVNVRQSPSDIIAEARTRLFDVLDAEVVDEPKGIEA